MKLGVNRKKEVSQEKILQVKEIRDQVKELVKDLTGQYFYEEPEEILRDIKICRPYMEELARLVKLFTGQFEEKKRSRNLIHFLGYGAVCPADPDQEGGRRAGALRCGGRIPAAVL